MEDSTFASKITIDFILWFQQLSQRHRDYASALMIANLQDEQLLRVRRLTGILSGE